MPSPIASDFDPINDSDSSQGNDGNDDNSMVIVEPEIVDLAPPAVDTKVIHFLV